MKQPLFTVVTLTRNSRQFLPDVIESVEKQTFTDYEHLFIDGESTDGTLELIKEYHSRSPRVRLVARKPNGIGSAMDSAIIESSGKYIIFMHSDDFFVDADVLKDVCGHLTTDKYDFVYGYVRRIDASKKTLYLTNRLFRFSSSILGRYILKYEDYLPHQSMFVKRDMYLKYGQFDPSYRISMDYEYWLRIRKVANWKFIDREVACFRVHSHSTSSDIANHNKLVLEVARLAKKNMNWFEFNVLRILFKLGVVIRYSLKEELQIHKELSELQ